MIRVISRMAMWLALVVSAGPVLAQDLGAPAFGRATAAQVRASSVTMPGAQQTIFHGDSLVAGTGASNGTISTTFQSSSGAYAVNLGIGGQTSTQVAKRMGAVATTLTIAGNAIGAYTVRNTVSAIDGIAPAAATAILSTPADTTIRELTGTITCSGANYHGTLTRTGTEAYYFRADSTSGSVTCAANAPFTVDFNWNARPLIFDMGRNDFTSTATVQANVAAVFAACAAAGNTQCYWLDVLTGPNEGANVADTGHANYVAIMALNAAVTAASPSGHVIDWRGYLVSQASASTPDQAAKADDQVPPSLQYGDGSVHLNTGYPIAGAYIYTLTKGALATRAATAMSVDNLNSILSQPLALTAPLSVNCGGRIAQYDGIEVCGKIKLTAGQPIVGTDLSSNLITLLLWNNVSGTISIGGANLQVLTLGNNYGSVTMGASGALQTPRGVQDTSYSYQAPATGATVTIADTSDLAIIDPAATLAALTVRLPTCSATYDGKIARFSTSQAATALTMSATAGTVIGAPASLAPNAAAGWICRGSSATWYRVQ